MTWLNLKPPSVAREGLPDLCRRAAARVRKGWLRGALFAPGLLAATSNVTACCGAGAVLLEAGFLNYSDLYEGKVSVLSANPSGDVVDARDRAWSTLSTIEPYFPELPPAERGKPGKPDRPSAVFNDAKGRTAEEVAVKLEEIAAVIEHEIANGIPHRRWDRDGDLPSV